MSEKEKKAIGEIDISKTIESNIDYWRNKCFEQQKEIEDLRIIADDIKGHNIIYTDTPEFEERFISKDKIREKARELTAMSISSDIYYEDVHKMFEELLGE